MAAQKSDKLKKITIVGAGYVGLTLAAILSNIGYKVYALDIDKNKIGIIKQGRSYFFEHGIDAFVKQGIDSGNLVPTTDCKEAILGAEAVFLCVGTPSNEDGSVNLNFVFEAVKSILQNAANDLIIVQKSTVPVETSKRVEKIISEYNENKAKVSLISSPEFLREGSAVFDTLFFDRAVIGGKNKEAIKAIEEIYRNIDNFAKTINYEKFIEYAFLNINQKYIEDLPVFQKRIIITNLESAELIKVTANSFLALKISFANTVARLCEKTGAKAGEVMEGVGIDQRIGKSFLYPGLGYGGGCLPKDVNGMINTANAYNVDFGILDEVNKVNETQVYFALDKIKKLLGDNLENKRAAFLGLAFKPGTNDTRESPALRLLNKILNEGMLVNAYDPEAKKEAEKELKHKNLRYADKIEDIFSDAEIIILATEWKEFIDFDFSRIINKMKALNFFDGRGVIDENKIKKLGFKLENFK